MTNINTAAEAGTDIEAALSRVESSLGRTIASVDRTVFDPSALGIKLMGKAVRARFSILAGRLAGAPAQAAELAAETAELTHTASLLHDDCVDEAVTRRGQAAVNALLGVSKAVLFGDLLMALAFERAEMISPSAASALARTVRLMTEGALFEENSRGSCLDEAGLYRLNRLKTGSLFAWCAETQATAAGLDGEIAAACRELGEETGVCFQLADDALDFESAAEKSGKDPLKDIFSGKHTLPVLLALKDPSAGPPLKKLLYGEGGRRDFSAAAGIIAGGGFARKAAEASAKRAATVVFPLIDRVAAGREAAELKDFVMSLADRDR